MGAHGWKAHGSRATDLGPENTLTDWGPLIGGPKSGVPRIGGPRIKRHGFGTRHSTYAPIGAHGLWDPNPGAHGLGAHGTRATDLGPDNPITDWGPRIGGPNPGAHGMRAHGSRATALGPDHPLNDWGPRIGGPTDWGPTDWGPTDLAPRNRELKTHSLP